MTAYDYEHPAMVLGGRDRRSPQEKLAARLQLILETEPGLLPWAPSFGCDLTGIVGGTAGRREISEVRKRITSALERWMPGVRLKSCQIDLIEVRAHDRRLHSVPRAEAALASRAVSGVLDVRIEIETDAGPLLFEALLEP